MQFWKCPVALCSNNAKSCYDRITLLAAALCLCQLVGALILVVQSMIKTIHSMNHHNCTVYGDSTQLASHSTWATSIMGIGQGNRAGPPIWAAVSLPMFKIMHQNGFYALLMGTISQQSQKVAGFAFVDDTDWCVMHPTNQQHQ